MKVYTDTEAADMLGLDLEKFHVLRLRNRWPHIKLGRYETRFTEDQLEQILAASTVADERSKGTARVSVPGQTARSAARRRSA